MSDRLSRRRLLQSGTLAGIGLLAGCIGGGDEPTGPRDPPGDMSITEVEVDRSDLVVRLQDGHAVNQLNLVGPDGEKVGETSVSVGVSTARIQLLDIQPDLGGYEHYEPGTHELVAVTESGSSSMDVDLVPDLQVVDVQQYRDGEEASDLGKLAVTVENVGSGPTWVYDITFQGAPNYTSNDSIIDDPGSPRVAKPETPRDLIIDPSNTQIYVSVTSPLQFDEKSRSGCEGTPDFSLIVGVTGGEKSEKPLTAQIEGDSRPVGMVDQFTCTEVSIRLSGPVETDE